MYIEINDLNGKLIMSKADLKTRTTDFILDIVSEGKSSLADNKYLWQILTCAFALVAVCMVRQTKRMTAD